MNIMEASEVFWIMLLYSDPQEALFCQFNLYTCNVGMRVDYPSMTIVPKELITIAIFN